MSYFSRLSSFNFGRPRRHSAAAVPAIPLPQPMMTGHISQFNTQPKRFKEEEIFIPPGEDEEEVEDHDVGFEGGIENEETPVKTATRDDDDQHDDQHMDEPVIPNNLLTLRPYRFRESKRTWKHVVTTGLKEKGREGDEMEGEFETRKPACSTVRIITWNVDMASSLHEERLTSALRHIQMDVLKCKEMDKRPEPPCIIMLQEVKDTVIEHLLSDEWVRRWFCVVPTTSDKWPEEAWYGNVTLVSRTLEIAECHILHFGLSNMQRAAVCVKVRLTQVGSREKSVVAFVNTHLESLRHGVIARPKQMEMCGRFLRLRGVQGGVVCGDMNAILEKDERLGKDVGLADAWKKDHDGNTWGYQGQNGGGVYPPGRLDRVFYLPGMGYKVDEPRKIGIGLTTREGSWVSDHYGLETLLHMLKPRSNSA